MSSHHARRRAFLTVLTLTATAAALGLSPATGPAGAPLDATLSTAAPSGPARSSVPVEAPAVSATPAATTSRPSTFIFQLTHAPAAPDELAAVGLAIEATGGRVTSTHAALGMLVARLPATAAARLSRRPGLRSVAPDRRAQPLSLGFDPASQPGSLTAVTRSTGAQTLWRAGLTGAGVDVALIDTGVSPVPALSAPTKVVIGPDLSFESQDANQRYLDGFGHGTHMGSVIAGRETPRASGAVYARDTQNFYGMAPDARLVSVKVGAHDGAVDVSQLIAAIDWVVQNRRRDGLNIRVLNLSFGTDSAQPWTVDPLSQAADVAAQAGILVVVAGGNDGENARGLADPAYNPNVLAVGAVDTQGTDRYDDDRVPSFSQHSDSALRSRPPDLVAPGVSIVAPAAPGSTLAARYPEALVGNGFLRGSGTSQAAAVVSGAAALLWQKWPNGSATQIRDQLVNSSTPLAHNGHQACAGDGEINLVAALAWPPSTSAPRAGDRRDGTRRDGTRRDGPQRDGPQRFARRTNAGASAGTGTLQGARGSNSVTLDGIALTGEQDIFGQAWDAHEQAVLTAGQQAWTLSTGSFNGNLWIGTGFRADTDTLAGRTWNGRTWAGRTWAGQTWSGQTWTGRTWAGQTWSGRTWAGPVWAATHWP